MAFPGLLLIRSFSDKTGGGSTIETLSGLPSAMMPLNFWTICWATSRFSTVSSAETVFELVVGANAAAMISTCCLNANCSHLFRVGHSSCERGITHLDVNRCRALHKSLNQDLHLRIRGSLDTKRRIQRSLLLYRRSRRRHRRSRTNRSGGPGFRHEQLDRCIIHVASRHTARRTCRCRAHSILEQSIASGAWSDGTSTARGLSVKKLYRSLALLRLLSRFCKSPHPV